MAERVYSEEREAQEARYMTLERPGRKEIDEVGLNVGLGFILGLKNDAGTDGGRREHV